MKRNGLSWKKHLVMMAVLVLVGAFLGGSGFAAEKIVLKKYPDMKIGFSTQNFLRPLPVSLENAKKLVDWANDQGFAWIEYRDPSVKLTLKECEQLAAYAKGKNLEVNYAAQGGIPDPEFWEIFYRGVANAAVFDGPKTFRTKIEGDEFIRNRKKTAWNLNELFRLVTKAKMAANIAQSKGLQYVGENDRPALKGDGISSFGTTEFFANVNSNMGWQMDTANFFVGSRVLPRPEEVQAFLEKNISKLYYVHIKSSSKEHKSTDILEENELPFDVIFKLLSKHKVNYLALELPQQPKLEDCQSNLMKSIQFLKNNY